MLRLRPQLPGQGDPLALQVNREDPDLDLLTDLDHLVRVPDTLMSIYPVMEIMVASMVATTLSVSP